MNSGACQKLLSKIKRNANYHLVMVLLLLLRLLLLQIQAKYGTDFKRDTHHFNPIGAPILIKFEILYRVIIQFCAVPYQISG